MTHSMTGTPMPTTPPLALAEWYLAESGGDLVTYYIGLRMGHRGGQAFFNALTDDDKDLVTGIQCDPFYFGNDVVTRCIEFLTTK